MNSLTAVVRSHVSFVEEQLSEEVDEHVEHLEPCLLTVFAFEYPRTSEGKVVRRVEYSLLKVICACFQCFHCRLQVQVLEFVDHHFDNVTCVEQLCPPCLEGLDSVVDVFVVILSLEEVCRSVV